MKLNFKQTAPKEGCYGDCTADYAVTVYTKILKQLFPEVPVVVGGIEASLRRVTHYDYWKDCLMPSILVSSGADFLTYGMGERGNIQIARFFDGNPERKTLRDLNQTGEGE